MDAGKVGLTATEAERAVLAAAERVVDAKAKKLPRKTIIDGEHRLEAAVEQMRATRTYDRAAE